MNGGTNHSSGRGKQRGTNHSQENNVRWWLGEHLVSGPSCFCSWCGSQADTFSNHAVSCARSNLVLRHQMATRALERVVRLAGVTYQRKQSVDSSSDRPADLLLRIGPKEDL